MSYQYSFVPEVLVTPKTIDSPHSSAPLVKVVPAASEPIKVVVNPTVVPKLEAEPIKPVVPVEPIKSTIAPKPAVITTESTKSPVAALPPKFESVKAAVTSAKIKAAVSKAAASAPTSETDGRLVFDVPEYPGEVTLDVNTLPTFVSLTMFRSFTEIYELILDTEDVYKICIKYCGDGHKRAQRFWSVGRRFLFALPCASGKVKLRFTMVEP